MKTMMSFLIFLCLTLSGCGSVEIKEPDVAAIQDTYAKRKAEVPEVQTYTIDGLTYVKRCLDCDDDNLIIVDKHELARLKQQAVNGKKLYESAQRQAAKFANAYNLELQAAAFTKAAQEHAKAEAAYLRQELKVEKGHSQVKDVLSFIKAFIAIGAAALLK